MSVHVAENYHASVVKIKGRFLGSTDGVMFRDILEGLKSRGRRYVVVDLSETDFMDSSGVGVLIAGLTSLRKTGGDMRLAALDKRIKNLFVMTHLLGSVFEDYPDADQASESFRDKPPVPETT